MTGLTKEQQCAWIAYRTWGTPGPSTDRRNNPGAQANSETQACDCRNGAQAALHRVKTCLPKS